MDKDPLLDLSLMYSVFDTYREKVLAGCPEGFDLSPEVGVGGIITIEFKRDSQWCPAPDLYITKVELLQGLAARLTDLGWIVGCEIVWLP